MADWVYHATTKQALAGIRRNGLVPRGQPRKHRGEPRVTDEDVIFFSVTADAAATWGPVVLRFPWPSDSDPDEYGDTTYTKEYGVIESNWYTSERISPKAIQIKTSQGWRKLAETK